MATGFMPHLHPIWGRAEEEAEWLFVSFERLGEEKHKWQWEEKHRGKDPSIMNKAQLSSSAPRRYGSSHSGGAGMMMMMMVCLSDYHFCSTLCPAFHHHHLPSVASDKQIKRLLYVGGENLLRNTISCLSSPKDEVLKLPDETVCTLNDPEVGH